MAGRGEQRRAWNRRADDSRRGSQMTDDHGERRLDLPGVLSELQALVGERVCVESGSAGAHPFHESRGVLGRSIDLQIAVGSPLDQPAWVAFYLEDSDSHFIVRESALRLAVAYTVGLPEGPSRTVQMHFAGGGVLIVREDLEEARSHQ
jgi:hypothetical protein